MKCSNCGAENSEGKVFCGDCGWRLFEPSPRNVEHVTHLRLGRVIISIALGMFCSWLVFGFLLQIGAGGAPTALNNLPFFYYSIEYIAGWLLVSAGCALLFYMTFTRGK